MDNFPFNESRNVPLSDARSSHARSPLVIPQVSDHFPDPARGPYIFPAWQSQLWLPQQRFARPDSPAESHTITTISPYQSTSAVVGEDQNSSKENNAGTKGRSPNWSDAEIRFLIAIWKDHHPISKRHNSAVWESIAKQLNKLLKEQGLTSIRTASQCKAKIKNLEDEYKRVKDHNNKSGNDRETFTYYEDLNEILGCRAKITPKTVVECGFEDDAVDKRSESSEAESDGDGEDQYLSEALFRRNPTANKGKKAVASTPNSSKQKSAKSSKADEALSFSESLFFKSKPGSNAGKRASSPAYQPPTKRYKKGESSGQGSGNTEYFGFLTESQKRDHEFFERLAEKEAEREIKSQEMMLSMVKEVAKIFKGE